MEKTTKSQNNRLLWIDFSRGLAFIMVIYSHIPTCDSGIMVFFSPIFLTTFFFVSGYLFKTGQSFSFVLEQRLRTLLIPFLILGLILIGMSSVFSFNEPISLKEALKGLLIQNGENEILWFIGALFIYSIFFYFIDKLCTSPLSLIIVAVLLFIINAVTFYWIKLGGLPWHLSFLGFAIFYMALGRLYRAYETKIDKYITKPVLILCGILYLGLIFTLKSYISFFGSKWIWDSMLITLCGLILIISISKKFGHLSKLLLFVGTNSLFYFAFHGKAYSLIFSMLSKFYPQWIEMNDILISLTVVIVDALILIIPARLTNKYLPFILGRGYKLWK